MDNGFNISDVILLSVTVLIIKRLASILGVTFYDVQSDSRPMKVVTPIKDDSESGFSKFISSCKKLVNKSDKSFELDKLSEKARNAIANIRQHDHSFEPRRFVKVMMSSYEELVQAMNSGSLVAVKDSCSNKVYDQLASYVTQNNKRGFAVQQQVVNFDSIDITDAKQIGGYDYLQVKLNMQLVRIVRNKDGDVIVSNHHTPSAISDELMLRRNSSQLKWQIWEIGPALTSNEIGSGE